MSGSTFHESRRRRRRVRRGILSAGLLLLLSLPTLSVTLALDGEGEPPTGSAGTPTAQTAPATGLNRERSADMITSSGASENPEATATAAQRTTESYLGEKTSVEQPRTTGVREREVLTAGAEDHSGGILTDHRLVSYYGHPLSGQMGVLGRYEDPQNMMADLKEQAAAYTELTPQRPAVPTIELIASVAQGSPGEDGLYLRRTSRETIEKYAEVAERNDALLLLDIQIGYSTIAKEIEAIKPFLKRPYVHLAIDCEWNMAPGQIPGQTFGQCSAGNIMDAADTLSKIVEENDLPPKVLVIHQFRSDMIVNKEALEPTKNVEMVIHADGFGLRKNKLSKYKLLVKNQPVQYGGFKLFYYQDVNMLSPEEILRKLDPNPVVISYQ